MRNPIRSPLFVPLVSAPVLFGIAALILSLGNYDGPWYYALYYLLHVLAAGLYFFALHLFFRDLSGKGSGRAFAAGLPILISLSVYHLAIAFFEAYVVEFEEAPTAIVYALLSLFTDSILGEWLPFALTAVAARLFFLRGKETPAGKRAAWLLASLVYFLFLLVGRIAEFRSYMSARLGVADEKTTVSFLLFVGIDLLFAALGYLVLFLFDRSANKGDSLG